MRKNIYSIVSLSRLLEPAYVRSRLCFISFLVVIAVLGGCGSSGTISESGDINTTTEIVETKADLDEGTDGSVSIVIDTKETDIEADNAATVSEETDKSTEHKSDFLKDLKDIPAGTVLSENEIDTENLDNYFNVSDITEGDRIYERINGRSYRDNDYVPLNSLVYLKLPHYNFDGKIQVGELIVCRDIKDDVLAVFKELFEAKYQIQSMYLIDNYWTGDPDSSDSASIDVNNTSSFCFRNATAGSKLSNHAYGRAIDINPQQNPYVSYKTGSPVWSHSNANDYIARDTGLPHLIDHDDLAYKVFTKYGFKWGGDWNSPKDYQHFEKKQ